LMLFPNEGHLVEKRENRERFVRETVSWLEQKLLGVEAKPLLGPDDPPPFRVLEGGPRAPFVLTCDHAGRRFPASLGTLGLDAAELERHIAWDIGAERVTELLHAELGAFAIVQTYSRLVIDCNRPLDSVTSIATLSEATLIPGNQFVSATDAERRATEIFRPYHARIEQELDRRDAAQVPTIYVAVHSFTPRFLERDRPFHVGVLYGHDTRFAHAVLELLRNEGHLVVGDNEPYFVSALSDFGVIEHAERRGLLYVEIEMRQDLVASDAGQREWSTRLARILREAAAQFL